MVIKYPNRRQLWKARGSESRFVALEMPRRELEQLVPPQHRTREGRNTFLLARFQLAFSLHTLFRTPLTRKWDYRQRVGRFSTNQGSTHSLQIYPQASLTFSPQRTLFPGSSRLCQAEHQHGGRRSFTLKPEHPGITIKCSCIL